MLALTSGGGGEPPELTLALAGDINLARGAARANAQAWPATFAALREALMGDLVVANLESPLTRAPHPGRGIDLRAAPEAVRALSPFTHLSVENNHALDGGAAGQAQSRASLRAQELTPLTRWASFQTIRGVRVALLAYLDDGSPPPLAQVRDAARAARVVIVLPHWGAEYGGVTTRQRGQARALAGAGASLVVGSGPHVLQGSERLGRALVLYSLGNLLFDQPYPAAWLGAVVRVQLRGESVSACAVPTFTRAGRVHPARRPDARAALERLGLAACGGPGRGQEGVRED